MKLTKTQLRVLRSIQSYEPSWTLRAYFPKTVTDHALDKLINLEAIKKHEIWNAYRLTPQGEEYLKAAVPE